MFSFINLGTLEYLVQDGILVLCLINWLLVLRLGSALVVLGLYVDERF